MKYYFIITRYGKFFANVDCDITMKDWALKQAEDFRMRFSAEDGYKVNVYRQEVVSERVE